MRNLEPRRRLGMRNLEPRRRLGMRNLEPRRRLGIMLNRRLSRRRRR